jgi:dTDP-4-dehydrorhamnose 3,5-epimerase
VNFVPLALNGAFRIELDPREDERGSFARTWCAREAEAHGLNPRVVQCSVSRNLLKGTLRGMHYQRPPHAEAKLVRCTRGAVLDVVLDLRPGSPTFKQWEALELTPDNGIQLYIPEGFAHGFQTLVDDTEVLYQMSEFHHPATACGVRWNDPAFEIAWPFADPILSERDASYPDFI